MEINFDGLVGPTHNYSGLSHGNLASVAHSQQASSPRAAALEGLDKMELLCRLGIPQAVLPPQDRPHLASLRRLGFGGSDAAVLEKVFKTAPHWLATFSSASAMWTANAATVAPSTDTEDGRAHFTPANLASKLHRSIEWTQTHRALNRIFGDAAKFAVHPALLTHEQLGDEGAANHTRLAPAHGAPGLHLFVYGSARGIAPTPPLRFPARQMLEASQAVASLNALQSAQTLFAAQSAEAINAGVFHNDVICVGNENVLFFHAAAFADEASVLRELSEKWKALGAQKPLCLRRVAATEVSLEDAVKSYLFNSQLITLPTGKMALIAPKECEQTPGVKKYLDRWLSERAELQEVHYPNLRQSMSNGGGPACLRLRVVLTPQQKAACLSGVFVDGPKIQTLRAWVQKHYRERLVLADLADAKLLQEHRTALDELTTILGLGSDFYDFQKA